LTPVPGPYVLLALLLFAAILAYLLRRWAALAAFLSAMTTGALAVLCLRLPLDRSAFVLGQEIAFGQPVIVAGRSLVLESAGQVWLCFAFGVAAILYLCAWRMSTERSFYAFSLAVLSLYVLIVLIHSFSLALLVFAMSTAPTVFMLHPGLRPTVRGALRYVVVTLLAVPLLLGAAWLIEQSLLDPESIELARLAVLPTALGFGLLLAVFPFGTWMPAVAADAPPLATAFIFTTGQSMTMFLALIFLRDFALHLPDQAALDAIRLAGLVMAAAGGLMAAVQRDLGRLFGFAALSDLGYLLLALAACGSQGSSLALLHMVNRAASITLFAAALSIVRQQATSDRFDRLVGFARRLPVATMGLMVGGLALAGFPFTAGFPVHWAVNRAVWNQVDPLAVWTQRLAVGTDITAGQTWIQALTLVAFLASAAGISIGLLRGLSAMLGDGPQGEVESQPTIASAMVLALAILVIALGLYPQLFLDPVRAAARAFMPL
jgi:formate hydrogenlyase subunit 3/multisubunit Na+/H+ antiporter MnhD subunit